ncbi:MAG: S-layer homology domain-containing protein [Acidaminococcaceae bacterium]|nr:S-layer homology domain-containing protein [Acidaminococcaceae bacterium]
MKKSLVLAMAMALGVTASAYAANPFSDVPAGHWAYDSVAKLAAAGVVDGYADGAFDGDKLMTRYEMAQIVAKAMAKGANVDKLAAEFADELDTLGVRVAKLEKGADAVKITGEVRYHYADNEVSKIKDKNIADNQLRSRLWFAGQVNEDWTYTAMLEHINKWDNDTDEEGDTKFQRAYVDGKLGGLKVRAGRYHLSLAQKAVFDHRFDGVTASYGKDVKVTFGGGKATTDSYNHVAYGELASKLGIVDAQVAYYDFQDDKTAKYEDKQILALGASLPVAKNVKLNALYLDGDMKKAVEDKGYQVSLAYKGAKASVPGSWGLEAFWYDLGDATYVNHTHNGLESSYLGSDTDSKLMGGFKGYSLQGTYALAKNIVAKVEWYDLEAQQGKAESETLWTQVVFTF